MTDRILTSFLTQEYGSTYLFDQQQLTYAQADNEAAALELPTCRVALEPSG